MKPTLPLIAPRRDARCVILPAHVTVLDVAEACRGAALGFAWGAHVAWGKRELARWLAGPYAIATEWATEGPTSARRPFRPRRLAETSVTDLLASAHAEVMWHVRELSRWPSDAAFARRMIDAGVVVGAVDVASSIGYVPVDGRYMRLADRVRSLFMADFLTRPTEYASFMVCDGCGSPAFDGTLSHTADCDAPLSYSVSLRQRPVRELAVPRSATLVGIGDRAAS